MASALQIIGWLAISAVALWSTAATYITAQFAMAGWCRRITPAMFAIVAAVFCWLAWASAPFSFHWEAGRGIQ